MPRSSSDVEAVVADVRRVENLYNEKESSWSPGISLAMAEEETQGCRLDQGV